MNYWLRDIYYIWDRDIPSVFSHQKPPIIGRLVDLPYLPRLNGYVFRFVHMGAIIMSEQSFRKARKATPDDLAKINDLP